MRKFIGMFAIAAFAVLGVSAPAMASTHGPTATVHAVKAVTATGTTVISNRPDSSSSGPNWANDSMTRVLHATLVGQVAPTNCPGTDTGKCYLWDFTITDSGTFTTIVGAPSPRIAGDTEEQALTGSINGGTSSGWSYVSWKTPNAANIKATENDNGTDPTGKRTTSLWFEQLFGNSHVVFNSDNTGAPELGNWSWKYVLGFGANTQCPNNAFQWIDANTNGGGSATADGNILTPVSTDCP